MLNKKDPLIDAIQQVMQSNQADRDAVKAVNEKFGIQDRRVLPRERQGEWDAAYQTILSEGVEALDEKSFAALAPPYDKATHKDKLVGAGVLEKHPTEPGKHVLAKEEKKMKGDDPCWKNYKMVGMKKKGGKPVPNCVPVSEEGDPSKAIPGDTVTGGSSVTPVPKPKTQAPAEPRPVGQADQSRLKTMIQNIKEAKKSAMCEGSMEKTMGEFKRGKLHSGSKTGPIVKSRDQAIAIGMNNEEKKIDEGFNNRHDLSVTASAGKQVVADQLNEDDFTSLEKEFERRGMQPPGGFAGGGAARTSKSGTVAGTKVKASDINTRTGEPFKRTPKPTKKYANAADELSPASKAKFRKTLDAKMKAGGVSGNVLKKPVAKAKAGKDAQPAPQSSPQPGTQPGRDASGNKVYNKAFTDLINNANARKSRVKAVSRPAKKVGTAPPAASSKLSTPPGTFAANLQRARQQAQGNRVAVNTSTATQAKPTVAAPPSKSGSGVKRNVQAVAAATAGAALGAGVPIASYMYATRDRAAPKSDVMSQPDIRPTKAISKSQRFRGSNDRVPQKQNSDVMSMPNIRPTKALAAPAGTGSGTSQAAAKAPTSYTAQKGDTVWNMAKKDIQNKRAQAVATVPDAGQGEISRARVTGVSNKDTSSRTNELLKSNQMTDQSARKMQIGKVVKTD